MPHKPYKGAKLTTTRPVWEGKTKKYLDPYFPDPELEKAVNLAVILKRPLLLMGEPGCGKSLLASAVAYEWFGANMQNDKKFFVWHVKSTSKAKEGLYEIDNMLRLQDATLKGGETVDLTIGPKYLEYGPLALAMQHSTPDDKAVLLIDEIDKADIDFSNDLLNELERNSYYITEIKKVESYPNNPFVIITSNGEKDLSDAFLRRCVFHYIDLFSPQKLESAETKRWMERIINARFGLGSSKKDPLREKAIETFIKLRQKLNTDQLSYRKTVSTSEFLDWFSVLKQFSDDKKLATEIGVDKELQNWINKSSSTIPFGNVLFKTIKSLLDLPTAL